MLWCISLNKNNSLRGKTILMSRLSISLVLLMIFFGVVTASAADQPKGGALLEEISHEAVTDGTEKIVFKLSATHTPKIFKIKGEKPRLVIDFFDTGYSTRVKKISNSDDYLIKSVRIGKHKDPPKTRIVVDLRTEREYDFKVDSQGQENILVITFYFEEDKSGAGGEVKKTDTVIELKVPESGPVQVIEPEQEEAGLPAADEAEPEMPPENNTPSSIEPAVAETEKEVEHEQEEPEPVGEEEEKSESQEAEERVNQIIANIKDPKPAAADPILLDVTYESTANDSEMVLFKLNDFYPPIVFGIEKGNPRVVCDFLDTGLASDIQPVIQTNGIFVSKIRTARHPNPEKVRVVLDLVANKNYDLQQVFFKEDNLFVIIISEFEKESVKALKTVPGSAQKQE